MITVASIFLFGCLSVDWNGDGYVTNADTDLAAQYETAGLIDSQLYDLTDASVARCPFVGLAANITVPFGTTPALLFGGWLVSAEGLYGNRVITRACHIESANCCYGRADFYAPWNCDKNGLPHFEVTWTATGPGWVSGIVGEN